MWYRLSINPEHLVSYFRREILPCFAIKRQSSTFFVSIKKKDRYKAFNSALKVLKVFALASFVLGLLGVSESFGQNPSMPDISANVSGTITCVNTSVKLNGNSKTLGVYYAWIGPGGYRSTGQNPVTSIPGDYTLTVKDPVNGGTATATVKVLLDTLSPVGVKAIVSGILTCKDTLVTLTGNSSTPAVTYAWTGPKSQVSSIKEPVVRNPGDYHLVVTNPANGCKSACNVKVAQNVTPPSGIVANVSGLLTCNVTKVKITGTSITKGVLYHWAGQGLSSQEQSPEVSVPGVYSLHVTDPLNGCSSMTSVTVTQNIAIPDMATAKVSDTLTCSNLKVSLTATSAAKEVSYSWKGPGQFFSTEPTFETSTAGNFDVTITNPLNGCAVKKSLIVVRDTTLPAEVDIKSPGIITCKSKTVTLTGSSSSPKVTYKWQGPSGFTSDLSAPFVSIPGNYEVVVTKPNGCSIKKSIKVDQNLVAPDGLAASAPGEISCKTPTVKLQVSSNIHQLTYLWNGPQGFSSNEKCPETKLPGNYTLTATNLENGCASKVSITLKGIACKEQSN